MPEWTREEFCTLLLFSARGADDLSALIPSRTSGAIDAVRAGIHGHHTGGNDSMLSGRMRDVLETPGLRAFCPVCSAELGDGAA